MGKRIPGASEEADDHPRTDSMGLDGLPADAYVFTLAQKTSRIRLLVEGSMVVQVGGHEGGR